MNVIYAEIQTSDKTKIRVSTDTVNGNTFGQIRVWTTDAKSGDFVPTRKGVAFKLDNVASLVEALTNMQVDLLEEGAKA